MPENVGRNKLAQFRHRGSTFAKGCRNCASKLVPAYGLSQQDLDALTVVGTYGG